MTRVVLTQDQWNDLSAALEMSGLSTDVRSDYSGRSMYGRTCIGFVTDVSLVDFGIRLVAELQTLNEVNQYQEDWKDFDIEDFHGSCTDNMGYSTIVYFPNISVEEKACVS